MPLLSSENGSSEPVKPRRAAATQDADAVAGRLGGKGKTNNSKQVFLGSKHCVSIQNLKCKNVRTRKGFPVPTPSSQGMEKNTAT